MKIQDPKFNYLKVDFYSATIRNILNCCVVNLFMPALILTMCCIDYIGIPLSGNTVNTKSTFKQFLNDYMSAANPKYKDKTIQDIIYAIRCSLVHTYGDAKSLQDLNIQPIFDVGNGCSRNHLLIYYDENIHSNCIKISILDFVSETIGAVELFFRNINVSTILIEWYKNLFVMSDASDAFNKLLCVQNDKIIYKNIHNFLGYLDSNENCDIEELVTTLNKELLEEYNNPKSLRDKE